MTTITLDGPAYRVRLDFAISSGVNGRASHDKLDGPRLTTATLPLGSGMMQKGFPQASTFSLASIARGLRKDIEQISISSLLCLYSA
jgi:hypothetical protein